LTQEVQAEMSNQLALDIESILRESLGEFIARATLKKNCELMGVSPDSLDNSQLMELADRIESSVNFFSGRDAASLVSGRVRALVASPEYQA
jgi:hypothetical protein